MGLRINEGKPKYMEVITWPRGLNEFKYLGTLVTNSKPLPPWTEGYAESKLCNRILKPVLDCR
jgi:hypothetical protein